VINTSSTLFVADTTNNRIVSIANANSGTGGTRTIIASFGTGLNPGQVRTPEGVTVSAFTTGSLSGGSSIIMSDVTYHRIQGRLVSSSTWIQLGGFGGGIGQFNQPGKVR
jgi:hypothetical protein